MADNDPVTLGKITYWCREKHYRHMQNACLEGLKRYGNDPILKFYYGFSLVLEDRVQEGMRELDHLKDMRDLNLGATLALIFAHKKSKMMDREAITMLDAKLKEERKTAGERGLYFAGVLLFFTEKYDKAREYVDRMLKMNPQSKEGLALKGWLEMLCGREAYAKKAIKYFDEALGQEGAKDIDALFGKSKYLEMRRNFSGALELVNQAVVLYSNFLPALVDKMKIQLALQDWDQTREVADRCLIVDGNCIQALRYNILYELCRDGSYGEASQHISDLCETMDRVEPKNHWLFDDMAKVFCRICGRNPLVLQQTYFLAERAVSLDSTRADYVTEMGYELLMQGKIRDAMKCYRNAMKLDETSVGALTGVIRCQLMEGQLEDASQQLEFLNEIQQSIGKTAELSHLSAVLAMKKQQAPEQVQALLNEAIETHFAGLKMAGYNILNRKLYEQNKDMLRNEGPDKTFNIDYEQNLINEHIINPRPAPKVIDISATGLPLGTDYYYHMNPDFLIQVVKDYLCYAPTQPSSKGQPVHPVLKRCSQVLEPLTRAVPGLLEALYLMGKVKFLSGDVDVAQATLQHCLDVDPTYSDAHILMAQIQLQQNNFKLADYSLNQGLSHNFEVRDHPLYHLIKARILKKQGDMADAAKTLTMAMSLPGVRRTPSGAMAQSKKKAAQITVNERVSVFLELAEAHRLLGEQHEAAKVMQDAINDFAGTPEEIRITIANCDLALARDDVEGALGMLRGIAPDQAYFVEAREKMAYIYLNHRKDKKLYASCYRELVDKHPSPHTCLLLGDAYMSIQEPEKAIEVYESALKKNPRDSMLASKIGQALVKTHNYGKAINYYEASLRGGGQLALRHDLAELLLKLRQYDKAEKVLKQALENDAGATDLDILIEHTRYYVLLSKVYNKQLRIEDSMQHLTLAADLQNRVLKRAQVEQPDAYPTQRQLASSISKEMALHAYQQRDFVKAIKYYKEALHHSENDGKIMLELAKLYMITEDLDACQHQCMTLLKNDNENDAATVMLADLMFRKNEYDQAMYHFQQLLERRPDHYEALARLVDLMRRAGKLDEVTRFLELAENSSGRATIDAGYNYCKGLYEWYVGNMAVALKHFNKARKDSDWGNNATYNMIEICLNPDNETIGGEVFVEGDSDMGSAAEKADSEQHAIRTAEKILREFKPKPSDLRAKILENMALVATKNKANVERAIAAFMEICASERDKDNVGALYGMAAAYMVLKQTPRARNQLKRVAKSTWNMEDAEDLEKSWLLLSDIYIQSGKFDMATELLKRCLQYNKSCCKAYEYMGFIMEKEQSYKDAAKNYENAWKYGNKGNPNIGYKLGFNYLKAKRYVDAIDICHHVISAHPQYPKIRKDILDKARQSIRV